jgi:hypothetical protein
MGTMAVVGSRAESAGMKAETTKATTKALDAGWRVATGGAKGTDATAIKTAVGAGKANMLDIYLPKGIDNQPVEVRSLLKAAKEGGANIVENAGGDSSHWPTLEKTRNTAIINNSDAAVVMQNNQSRGSQDALTKALKADIPIKKFSFTEGLLKTVSKFNVGLAAIGLLEQFMEYKEIQDYFQETQELIERWKKGPPTYTKEDAEKLKARGFKNTTLPYSNTDLTSLDPEKYYGEHGAGNPYHDGQGKFCSADNAVVTCWS